MKTNEEILLAYRSAVIELEELETQLSRTGTDGRPAGMHSAGFGRLPSTNDPAAAALQQAIGLEQMIHRKRDELAQLNAPVYDILSQVTGCRLFQVVHNYYINGRTDEQIGRMLNLSTARVNQMRRGYVRSIS